MRDQVWVTESTTGKDYFFYVFWPPRDDIQYFKLLSKLTKNFNNIGTILIYEDDYYNLYKFSGGRLDNGNFLMHHACESKHIEDYPFMEFDVNYDWLNTP